MDHRLVVGVDFGNTNLRLAVCDASGLPESVSLPNAPKNINFSALCTKSSPFLVCEDAVKELILHPISVHHHLKSHIEDVGPEILKLIFEHVLKIATRRKNRRVNDYGVVVSAPDWCIPFLLNLRREMKLVSIFSSPICCASGLFVQNGRPHVNGMYCHFGSSGSEVSIISVKEGGDAWRVITSEWSRSICMHSVVQLLVKESMDVFSAEGNAMGISSSDRENARARIEIGCEEALFRSGENRHFIFRSGRMPCGVTSIEIRKTHSQLKSMCNSIVQRLAAMCSAVMKRANVDVTSLEEIVFFGKGCQLPGCREHLVKCFGAEISILKKNCEEELICHGAAALQARIAHNPTSHINLHLPFSVALKVYYVSEDGSAELKNHVLLHQRSALPCSTSIRVKPTNLGHGTQRAVVLWFTRIVTSFETTSDAVTSEPVLIGEYVVRNVFPKGPLDIEVRAKSPMFFEVRVRDSTMRFSRSYVVSFSRVSSAFRAWSKMRGMGISLYDPKEEEEEEEEVDVSVPVDQSFAFAGREQFDKTSEIDQSASRLLSPCASRIGFSRFSQWVDGESQLNFSVFSNSVTPAVCTPNFRSSTGLGGTRAQPTSPYVNIPRPHSSSSTFRWGISPQRGDTPSSLSKRRPTSAAPVSSRRRQRVVTLEEQYVLTPPSSLSRRNEIEEYIDCVDFEEVMVPMWEWVHPLPEYSPEEMRASFYGCYLDPSQFEKRNYLSLLSKEDAIMRREYCDHLRNVIDTIAPKKLKTRRGVADCMDENGVFAASACGIGDEAIPSIVFLCRSNMCFSTLDLSDNNLSERGVSHLVLELDVVRNLCRNITSLILDGNNIGGSGVKTIFGSEIPLHILSLKKCYLGSSGVGDALFDSCSVLCSSLLELRLDENELREGGMESLSSFISACHSLRKFSLSNNGIGDTGAVYLAQNLCLLKNLESLDAMCNNISSSGCGAVVEGLTASGAPLTHLDLSENPLSDGGAACLTGIMRNKQTIASLILRGTGISTKGAILLATAIELCSSIRILDLSGNNLVSGRLLESIRKELRDRELKDDIKRSAQRRINSQVPGEIAKLDVRLREVVPENKFCSPREWLKRIGRRRRGTRHEGEDESLDPILALTSFRSHLAK